MLFVLFFSTSHLANTTLDTAQSTSSADVSTSSQDTYNTNRTKTKHKTTPKQCKPLRRRAFHGNIEKSGQCTPTRSTHALALKTTCSKTFYQPVALAPVSLFGNWYVQPTIGTAENCCSRRQYSSVEKFAWVESDPSGMTV